MYVCMYVCIYIYIYIYRPPGHGACELHSRLQARNNRVIVRNRGEPSLGKRELERRIPRLHPRANSRRGLQRLSEISVRTKQVSCRYSWKTVFSRRFPWTTWGNTNRVVSNRVVSKGPLYPSKTNNIIFVVF